MSKGWKFWFGVLWFLIIWDAFWMVYSALYSTTGWVLFYLGFFFFQIGILVANYFITYPMAVSNKRRQEELDRFWQ